MPISAQTALHSNDRLELQDHFSKPQVQVHETQRIDTN
jgi:hypothetical protein